MATGVLARLAGLAAGARSQLRLPISGAVLLLSLAASMLLVPAGVVWADSSARGVSAAELPAAIAAAKDGDTITVTSGVYQGNLEIDKSLTLLGIDWPTVDGGGTGTVMKISAPDTTIRGFRIINSGSSLDQENAGIAVEAPRVTIAGNRFEDTLFGIYLLEAHGSVVRDNDMQGKDLEVPRRGDAIRVWYSTDVLIENNRVSAGRDVVLWYSERLTVRENVVSDGRYGLHFMYCDDAVIEGNQLLNNSVGAFLMYSRRLNMQHNTVAFNRGPSGYGVGLKDMDDAIVTGNLFLDNRVGAHLDLSPREVDSIGRFEGNVFGFNDIGVEMMPSVRHNEFFTNSFIENQEQVSLAGGGQPGENAWTVDGRGNFWSDYAGFDADGDGQGDVEYRAERLFELLMQEKPEFRLFLYSPVSNAVDFAARAFPFVRPQPKLVDEQPYTTPTMPAQAPALPATGAEVWLLPALVLIVCALGLLGLPRLNRRRYHFPGPEHNAIARENA